MVGRTSKTWLKGELTYRVREFVDKTIRRGRIMPRDLNPDFERI
jgi:hypothetical protein